MKTGKKIIIRLLWISGGAAILFGLLPLLLFCINGLLLADNEDAVVITTAHPPLSSEQPEKEIVLKVMSWNVAKLFFHNGGIRFDPPEKVRKRLRKMSNIINAEAPDIVFLCEIIRECTPCPVNQIAELAESCGMHMWAFGENYNFGLPFYRIVGGNAIISRIPLQSVGNLTLVGRQPFYVTKNNRRALFCSAQIGGKTVLLGSLHNDSYSRKNNLAQAHQILDYIGERDALLAGDFNAAPHEPPMKAFWESGKFSGEMKGPFTFPTQKPRETIDFILGPASWQVASHRVIFSDASDHLPVVTEFRIKVR